MVELAYILFDGKGGGEFAFGCVTGAIHDADKSDAVEFIRLGRNDEMDQACGDGWAELQPDGSIKRHICFYGGDDASFTRAPSEGFFNSVPKRGRMVDADFSRGTRCFTVWPMRRKVVIGARPCPKYAGRSVSFIHEVLTNASQADKIHQWHR